MWFLGALLAIRGWALNRRLGHSVSGGVNPMATTDAFPVEPAFAIGTAFICASLAASVVAVLVRFRDERHRRVRAVRSWPHVRDRAASRSPNGVAITAEHGIDPEHVGQGFFAFVAAIRGMRTASQVESCEPTASTHIRQLSLPE